MAAARRKLGIKENARVALFFGFIRAYKGLDILLEALAQTNDIQLIVAGECYEPWDRYARIIEEKGIAYRVHLFTDFIPTDEVNLYFSAADIVVQPYKTATQSGISQIAYHFNKPMIVSNVGGLPEIVKDGISGYVVKPEPEDTARALTDFFDNNRAKAMKSGVEKEKARFSWAYFVDVLLSKD
jgi:D-inositol-3-phosphate glycosyltransferase